ncbi:MAG: PorT family protein [Bacteroides sp.]|nr:PorT family protein [Bacteroides sp.]
MKKRLLTIVGLMSVLLVASTTVKAQDNFVTLGVKGGLNLSDYSGDIPKTKSVLKYQFGITADFALTNDIYIISGLEFQTKGTKSRPHGIPNVKYNPMYLQLPVHAAYKIDIAPGHRFVVEAGPYLAYGIGGKMKGTDKVSIFHDDRFKRFDFGVGGALGWEFGRHIVLKSGYDFGLVDVCDVKGIKAKNMNGYVTLGYRF